MTDLNKGLFVMNKLEPFGEDPGKYYCRVIGCSIYSIESKARNRLVAYKVGYWKEEPVTIEDFASVNVYRNKEQNIIVYVFETPAVPLTREDLIKLCNKHFIELATLNYQAKDLATELNNLINIPSAKTVLSKFNPGTTVKVWDLLHVEKYESTNGLYPNLVIKEMRYKGNFYKSGGEQFQITYAPEHYKRIDSEWLMPISNIAISDMDSLETINYCKEHFTRNF